MRGLDILPIALLAALLLVSVLPRLPRRVPLLWLFGLAAAGVAGWQAVEGRWQALPLVAAALLALAALAILTVRGKAPLSRPGSLLGAGGRLLLTLLLAGGAFLLWSFPATRLPSSLGPDRVGTITFDLTDAARTDDFAPTPRPRRVQVQVWYPAEIAPGARPRPYLTREEADAVAVPFAIQFGQPTFTWRHLPLLATNSYTDAPPKPAETPRPLIVFNHGYWSIPMQNSVLMEELASRGYIVLSISHPYDTAAVRFTDGGVAAVDASQTMKTIMESEGLDDLNAYLSATDPGKRYRALMRLKARDLSHARMFASSGVWRADIDFVLNSIAGGTLPDSVREVLDGADMERIGLVGMSFGGSTTAGFCLRDARCKAGVNLDAMAWDQDQYAATMPVPFMVLMSDPRAGRPDADIRYGRTDYMYERPEDAGTIPYVHRFMIAGSTHPAFTDFTTLLRGPARDRLMRLGTIDGKSMLATTNGFVLAFFDAYLKGIGKRDFPASALAAFPKASVHDVGYVREWARSAEGQAALNRSASSAEMPAASGRP